MGVERLYNSVEFDAPIELKIRRSYRRNVVGKATSGRRGLWALMSWGPEKMLIRCRKESHHPAVWPLGLRLSIRRTRKTQLDGQKFGGQNIAVVFDLQLSLSLSLSLTRKPWTTLSNPCNKVRGIYFSKEVFLRLYHCVRLLFIASVCIQHRYVYSCMNMHIRMQHRDARFSKRNIYQWSKYGFAAANQSRKDSSWSENKLTLQ